MTIKEITYQARRDFKAIFACSACGYEEERWGYDDDNFHRNVVPKIQCPHCGLSEDDLDTDYRPMGTKYAEGVQI